MTFRAVREEDGGVTFDRDAVSAVQIVDPRRCVILVSAADGAEELFSVVDPRMWFDLLGGSGQGLEKTSENTESAE